MIHQIGQGSCNDTSTVFVLAASRIDFSDLITLCQRRASRKQIEYTADQQKQDNPCDQLPGGNTVSAVYHAKCDHYKKSNWYNISQQPKNSKHHMTDLISCYTNYSKIAQKENHCYRK